MFREAIKTATKFTRPIVTSWLTVDGNCGTGLGACVVLNRDGYFLTAHHIIALLDEMGRQTRICDTFETEKTRIEADATLDHREKRKQIRALLRPTKQSIRRFSPWFGDDALRISGGNSLVAVDLAVGKWDNFDARSVSEYPRLKNPASMPTGVSLCKLGYPFHNLPTTYDDSRQAFVMSPQLTFFPLEGMLTRFVDIIHPDPQSGFPERMIETSSPGLRGQSGGPTFDDQGTLWAIQSQTSSLPLGFDPLVPGSKDRHEHQFLNVGWGVSVETIVPFLQQLGIQFEMAAY